MIIYLVRHGQTSDNVMNKMQGWKDTPLNEKGIEQAKALIPFFNDQPIDVIYSSDLSRAKVTATIIANSLNKKVYEDKVYREMYMGNWEGKTWQDIEHTFGNFLSKPDNEKNAIPIHHGEAYIEFQKRSYESFIKLCKKHPKQTLILVTHGGYIREVVAYIEHLNQFEKDSISIHNCSVSMIEYDEVLDRFIVHALCII